MGGERVGLRERKKQQTRRELADAALRLFSERGYATTSVADIAAAAGVSTRTFFAYFPSKDDALFADTDERLALMHGLLRDLPAGTAPIRAFREIIERIFTAAASDLVGPHQQSRLRLIMEEPGLQGRALHRLLAAQQQIARDLVDAFDGALAETDAVMITGAVVGALVGVALHGMERGEDAASMRAAMTRAIDQLERGLGQVGAGSDGAGSARPR